MGNVCIEITHLFDDIVNNRSLGQDNLTPFDATVEPPTRAKVDQCFWMPAIDYILC
jgi:hypothetical protein